MSKIVSHRSRWRNVAKMWWRQQNAARAINFTFSKTFFSSTSRIIASSSMKRIANIKITFFWKSRFELDPINWLRKHKQDNLLFKIDMYFTLVTIKFSCRSTTINIRSQKLFGSSLESFVLHNKKSRSQRSEWRRRIRNLHTNIMNQQA